MPFQIPRSTPSRRALLFGGVAVAVIGALVVVLATGGSASAGYRTAEVTHQRVAQVLDGVATIEPVEQAAVAFPVAGTVESVDVSVGDTVATGDVLAQLDTTSLERSLDDKQASLDQANLTLERALNGENVGSPSSSGGSVPGGGGDGTIAPTSGSGPSALGSGSVELASYSAASTVTDADIAAAQQAVLAAQQQVDADLATAAAALDSAGQVCAAPDAAACQTALVAALAAQQAVAGSQAAVQSASQQLDALLDQRATETPPTTTPTTPPTTTPAQAAPSGSTNGSVGGAPTGGPSVSGGNGTTSSGPSSEDLIAYQKAVDRSVLEVLVAQQAIRQATIVSPFAGRVAAVGLAVGDDVDAESDTATVVIVGSGGYEVTTLVEVADLPNLELGQAATVVPDGQDDALDGEVVRIGVLGDSGSYPVTIGLTGRGGADLGNGSTASVAIVTAEADDALAVPTSAVTVDGDRRTVTVLEGGDPKVTTVEVGAVGPTWTEITSGLDAGQAVVLADLDKPLPGSATDTSSTDGGNFPGGGNFPAGGPSGGPPNVVISGGP